jgi:hypothetical protein
LDDEPVQSIIRHRTNDEEIFFPLEKKMEKINVFVLLLIILIAVVAASNFLALTYGIVIIFFAILIASISGDKSLSLPIVPIFILFLVLSLMSPSETRRSQVTIVKIDGEKNEDSLIVNREH